MPDMITDIRAVEAGDDQPVFRDPELGKDVDPCAVVRSRCQCEARHFRMIVEKRFQLPIVGPEIVAPLADAMRFVDRDQSEVHPVDEPPESIERCALGRNVEQVEIAVAEPLDGALAITVGAGQRGCADADRFRTSDLIVHERDERRDDKRRAFARERRELVAKRLAGTRRHDPKRVIAGENASDHLLLNAAELVEAEGLFEDRMRAGHLLNCLADRVRRRSLQ